MRNVVGDNYPKGTARGETGALLRELVRTHARLQKEVVDCCGVTSAQCQVLTELARVEQASVAELARRLKVDKGWVSRILAALEGEGLIAKRSGSDDSRLVFVSLTEAGHERAAEVDRVLDEQAMRVLGRVTEDRRQAAVEALWLLVKAIREEAGVEE